MKKPLILLPWDLTPFAAGQSELRIIPITVVFWRSKK